MTSVVCTSELLRETIALLRRGGELAEERVVLWLARSTAHDPAPIAEVYEPAQLTDVDYFRLPPESIRRLMIHLRATRRKIAAQIHTHPGRAFHSEADAEWAIIRHVGALSLVLPRFAESTTPSNFLREVVTYEYSAKGEWLHRPNRGDDLRLVVIK
jgi:proteasome lid subunit RPN8/RPN11